MTPTDPRRRMLPIVAMALFIDSMGIGIIIPVAPQLVMNLSGLTLADAAPIAGWLTLAYASMQFVFSPILGNLSDRHGRKPILLASLAALAVDYVLMGFAPTLTWLFIGRIIAGIAGATFATANAVVADIIPPDQRAKYFGLNGAAWGMVFIVVPVVGGLLGQYGPRVPFFAAAAFTALNFLIALALLKETLPEDNRRAFSARRANVLGALRSMRAIQRTAVALAQRLGDSDVTAVTATAGPEQEYFLVDKAWIALRPDLAEDEVLLVARGDARLDVELVVVRRVLLHQERLDARAGQSRHAHGAEFGQHHRAVDVHRGRDALEVVVEAVVDLELVANGEPVLLLGVAAVAIAEALRVEVLQGALVRRRIAGHDGLQQDGQGQDVEEVLEHAGMAALAGAVLGGYLSADPPGRFRPWRLETLRAPRLQPCVPYWLS